MNGTAAGAPGPGVVEDVTSWLAFTALEATVRVAGLWLGWLGDVGIPRIPGPRGGPDGLTVPILGSVTRRPLQLRCESFRAIGWGEDFSIDARHMTFRPEVLGARHNEFVVAVSTTDLPDEARRRTIVYEGVVADRTGKPVCDTIHFVKPAE